MAIYGLFPLFQIHIIQYFIQELALLLAIGLHIFVDHQVKGDHVARIISLFMYNTTFVVFLYDFKTFPIRAVGYSSMSESME